MRLFFQTGRAATLFCLLTIVISSAISFPANTSTANQLAPLHKRTNGLRPLYINGLFLKAYQEIAIIVPIQITAANLKNFYAATSHKAGTVWIHGLPNPLTHFAVKWNGIELHFVTNGEAPAGMGISWEFVRDFTKLMHEVTVSGFTGCYDQGFWNAAGTFGIFVGLRFVNRQLGWVPQ